MLIDDYAAWADRVVGDGDGATENVNPSTLSYLGLGLVGEAGEVAGEIKKLLRDGNWDPQRVADELGDVAYYWARLCVAVGVTPSELLDRSVEKIEVKLSSSRT